MWRTLALEAALLLSLASHASISLAFFPKLPPCRSRVAYLDEKRLFYSSGLEDFLGSQEFNSTIPGDDAILEAYDSWRREYKKGDYRQDRFENFSINYKTLMAANAASMRRARKGGKGDPSSMMSLNEYGDCSIEEYKNILKTLGQPQYDGMIGVERIPASGSYNDQNAQSAIESADDYRDEMTPMHESKEDIILLAYVDWCKKHGNEFDESRLPIFTEHYLNAENYFKQVGKPVKLNKYADLTADEYNRLLASNGEHESSQETADAKKQSTSPDSPAVSAGSYLENIATGKTTSTYFGEKKELRGEDLSDLYASISNAEREEEAKIHSLRAEIAAIEDEEASRLKREGVKATEEVRQRGQEEARLKAWEEARRKADDEAKQKAAEALKQNKESQRETGRASGTPFRPLSGSYMGAVAKTWESRSEYLAKLQASNEYLNKMDDSTDADLSEMYDQLDSFTGSSPIPLTTDTGPSKDLPTLSSIGDGWEDDIEVTNKKLAKVREAAELLERRREDERVAQRARGEAEEWMRVQKRLEEQADLAKQRREREEKAMEEAQRRARELEAANLEREQRQQEVQAIEAQRQVDEKARTEHSKQLRETEEKAFKDAQRKANKFEQKKKSKSKGLFSIFRPAKEATEEEVTPSDKKSSLSSLSFLTGAKLDDDGLSKKAAPSVDEPRRKSPIPLFDGKPKSKDEPQVNSIPSDQEMSAPFSFFQSNTSADGEKAGKMAAYEKNQRARKEKAAKAEAQRSKIFDEIATNEPQTGFIPSWFQKEKKKEGSSTAIPTISLWSQNEDGTIAGVVDNSNDFSPGVRITTSPVLGRVRAGTVVTTVSGSRYQLGAADKKGSSGGEAAVELLQKTIEFLGELPKKREVALLSNWQENGDGTITGIVQKKKGFNDGAKITTSPVAGTIRAGRVVKTRGGSFYRLL